MLDPRKSPAVSEVVERLTLADVRLLLAGLARLDASAPDVSRLRRSLEAIEGCGYPADRPMFGLLVRPCTCGAAARPGETSGTWTCDTDEGCGAVFRVRSK